MSARRIHRVWTRLLAAAIACTAFALGGCGGGDSAPPPSEGQATIGAAGGTVQGPDGVQLIVPDGALATETTIRIARDAGGAPEVGGLRLLTPIYQLTPHGAEFETPVRIRIPFDRTALRSSTAPVIIRAQAGSDHWEMLATDVQDGVAAADSFGFSYYAVGECFIGAEIGIPGEPLARCPAQFSLRLQLYDGNGAWMPQPRSPSGTLLPALTIDAPTRLSIAVHYSRPDTGVVDTIDLSSSHRNPAELQRTLTVAAHESGYTHSLSVLIDPAQTPEASRPGGARVRIWAWVSRDFDAFFPGCLCWRKAWWTFRAELMVKVVYRGVQPTITQQPANASITAGQTATFNVVATAPAPFLTYQWQQAGAGATAFADIPGATAAAYTTPAAVIGDHGNRYRVKVCTRGGTPTVDTCVFSSEAVLTVVPAATPPAFTTQPQSMSVVQGQTASFTAVATGTPAPTVRWYRDTASNPVGSPCAGGTGPTTCTYTTPPVTPAYNGARFFAIASNGAAPDATSAAATLTVTEAATPPAIPANEPADVTVNVGRSATFSVNATGTAPLSYQWQRDGVNIAGANAASYTLANAQLSDSGARFRVIVSNGQGNVTSREATLTVTAPPPPAGVCTSSNPAGWCWVRPAPHSNALTALAFDGATVHAIGSRTSMRSGDDGETWQTAFNSFNVSWTDLASPSSGVLLAAGYGEDGGIYRSTDGGQTWVPVLAQIVNAIAFESATTGIAVGVDTGAVWRTTDGGNNWSEVQAQGAMGLYRIVSPAAGVYVALQGVNGSYKIRRSTDGGLTWSTVASAAGGDALTDVAFANGTGVAVTGQGAVLRTTDGGATWSVPIVLDGAGALQTVAFADANTVVAMSGQGKVFRSTDAGLTWTAGEDLFFAGAGFLPRLKFRDATTGYAVGNYGQVWRTTDAGQSWSLVAGGRNEILHSVRFRGDDGLAAGSAGVWLTQNGGASWNKVDDFSSFDLALLDNSVRVAVGYYIRRSSDRGQTWTTVYDIVSGQLFTAVDFVPSTGTATIGVAVGTAAGGGSMLRTTDGGASWSPVAIGTVPALSAVSFSPTHPGVGLAGGVNRTLLRTTDGGANWIPVTVPALGANETIQAIGFSPTGAAMIAADGGLYRSTDGGLTWTRVYASVRGSMTGLTFLSATQAVAVGVQGTIVLSTDAGVNWTEVDVPVTAHLESVAYTGNGSEVVAVGEGGTILRNTQGGAP
jgi:photosystem II stability/assembly factor-like uncharacterized protein